MTDAEIIKALKCCLDTSPLTCKDCPMFNVTNSTMVCSKIVTKFALDLINRQQAQLADERAKIEICAETISRQDEEIERLRNENEILSKNADTAFQDGLNEAQDLYDEQIKDEVKAESIKEFAERLKNEIISETAYGCDSNQHTGYYDYQIKIGDIPEYIDNLVKEMVGEE